MGSGAILTAAGRYLADRLVESVVEHGPGDGPFADRLGELSEAGSDDQVVLARREVVDHCLYGVDKNPIAAEMAKLSLWLTTMARERPFTFLDHAIQVGDALLGITDMEQLRWLHLDPSERKGQTGFATLALDMRLQEASDLARQLQELSVVTVRDASEKQRLHEELRSNLKDLSVVADGVVGAAISVGGKAGSSLDQRLDSQMERIRSALDNDRTEIERGAALNALEGVVEAWLRTDIPDDAPDPSGRRCLHWPLAFPEVFLEEVREGFDGIVANPPFLGGKRISGANGVAYREHLVATLANGVTGNADLVTYFLLRMCGMAKSVGTLATNTLSRGDTREVGLDRLVDAGWAVHRAVKSESWPNEAKVEIAKAWMYRGDWRGFRLLNGAPADEIAPSLERAGRVAGKPNRLSSNSRHSFQGSVVVGMGFVLEPAIAESLIKLNPSNADVIRPYLSGADLNDDPQQRPGRFVINFFGWSIDRAQEYPECFEIVERLVKPGRSKVNRRAHREKWWIYGDKRPALYKAIADKSEVLAIARVSGTVVPALVSTDVVFHEKVIVFPDGKLGLLGLLTSCFHWWWVFRWSSTLRGLGNINYSPSDVFVTFPQPALQLGRTPDRVLVCAAALNEYRGDLMFSSQLGLTKTYNRVHDPSEDDPGILRLRELHEDLDHAVRDAYGWGDLALNHRHWETPQGMRFTVSEDAKDELLDRLLMLNHERYAAEVAAGQHGEKTKEAPRKRAKKTVNPAQETLL